MKRLKWFQRFINVPLLENVVVIEQGVDVNAFKGNQLKTILKRYPNTKCVIYKTDGSLVLNKFAERYAFNRGITLYATKIHDKDGVYSDNCGVVNETSIYARLKRDLEMIKKNGYILHRVPKKWVKPVKDSVVVDGELTTMQKVQSQRGFDIHTHGFYMINHPEFSFVVNHDMRIMMPMSRIDKIVRELYNYIKKCRDDGDKTTVFGDDDVYTLDDHKYHFKTMKEENSDKMTVRVLMNLTGTHPTSIHDEDGFQLIDWSNRNKAYKESVANDKMEA